MRKHLVNLLFIEYKHLRLVETINEVGFVNLEWVHGSYDNFEIVLDIIGFPRDSAHLRKGEE
ncbi:hypothetical protein GCM10023184_45580 [Flaviaesturariibacter amylovorans]|uniref:Uncharacterized protein n=1 Tax=Flaviaesturariibacter amylovorans TaxID=1084520 RepID=A0ABP8HTU5_9BACT